MVCSVVEFFGSAQWEQQGSVQDKVDPGGQDDSLHSLAHVANDGSPCHEKKW